MSETGTNVEFNEFKDTLDSLQCEADTYGMFVKFGGLNIDIQLNKENLDRITKLVAEFDTKNLLKKGVLYLKPKYVSEKQKEEILNQGPMTVKVKFECTGVLENLEDDIRHLVFKLIGLKKVSNKSKFVPLDDL